MKRNFLLMCFLSLLAIGCSQPNFHSGHSYNYQPRSSSSGQYMKDSAITAKVKTELLTARNTPSMDINVETINGIVYLRGDVQNRIQEKNAINVAQSVSGVKGVESRLRIVQ